MNVKNNFFELNNVSPNFRIADTPEIELLKQDTKVVTIFLRVPKDELQKRLESRIDKPSPKEIQLRLNRFDFEESKIGIYDYVIKNNDLEKTVSIIQKIIEEEANVKNTEF